MKKIISLIALCYLIGNPAVYAQNLLSGSFNKELMALIKGDLILDIKGKELEHMDGVAYVYACKLPLSGFELNYVETGLGNALSGRYTHVGSEVIMDALAEKFIELPYATMDSKRDKKVLGPALYASDLKRRIKLVTVDGNPVLVVELNKDNLITLQFFKD